VVEGEKHFVLLPPCSAMGLYEREYVLSEDVGVANDDD